MRGRSQARVNAQTRPTQRWWDATGGLAPDRPVLPGQDLRNRRAGAAERQALRWNRLSRVGRPREAEDAALWGRALGPGPAGFESVRLGRAPAGRHGAVVAPRGPGMCASGKAAGSDAAGRRRMAGSFVDPDGMVTQAFRDAAPSTTGGLKPPKR